MRIAALVNQSRWSEGVDIADIAAAICNIDPLLHLTRRRPACHRPACRLLARMSRLTHPGSHVARRRPGPGLPPGRLTPGSARPAIPGLDPDQWAGPARAPAHGPCAGPRSSAVCLHPRYGCGLAGPWRPAGARACAHATGRVCAGGDRVREGCPAQGTGRSGTRDWPARRKKGAAGARDGAARWMDGPAVLRHVGHRCAAGASDAGRGG